METPPGIITCGFPEVTEPPYKIIVCIIYFLLGIIILGCSLFFYKKAKNGHINNRSPSTKQSDNKEVLIYNFYLIMYLGIIEDVFRLIKFLNVILILVPL